MSDRRSYKAKDIYLSKKSANVALVKVRASHLDLFLSRALSVDIRKIESFDGKRAVYHSVVHSNLEQPETVLIRTKRITTGVSLESLYEAMSVKDSEVDINVNVFSEYDAFSLVKFTSYDGQINTDLNVETKFVNVIVEFETSADLDTFIESKVYSLEDIGLTVNVVSDYDPTIIIPEDKDLTVFVLSSYDAVASVMEEINITVDATSIYDAETTVLFVEYNTDVDTDVQVDTLESALEEVDITITASSNYDAEGLVVFVEYETSVDTDTTVEIMTSQVEEVNTTTVASSDYDAITIYVDEAVGIGVSVSSDYDAETVVVFTEFNTDVNTEMGVYISGVGALETNVGVNVNSTFDAFTIYVDEEVGVDLTVTSDYDAETIVTFTDYETDVSTELDVETVASELEDVDMTTVVSSDYDADTAVKFVEYETSVDTDLDTQYVESTLEEIDVTVNVGSDYDAETVVTFIDVDVPVNAVSDYDAETVVKFVELNTSVDIDIDVEFAESTLEDINVVTVASSDYDADTMVKFVEYETSVDTDTDVGVIISKLEDINVTTIASSDYDADTIVKFTEFDTFVNTDVDVDTMISVVEDINTTITSSSNYDGFVILQEEVNTTVDVSSEYEAIVPILYENDFEQYSDFDDLTNEDWTMLVSETGDLLQARDRAATDFGDVSLFFYNEFFTAGTSIWKWDEVSLPSQTDGQLLIRQTPDNSDDEIIHLMKSGESNGSFYGLGFARDCDNNVAKIVHFDGDYDNYNTLVDTSLDGIIGNQETVWWRFIIEEQTDGSFDLTLRLATVLDGSNESTLLTTNYDGNLASPTAPFSEAWNVVYGAQALWLDYYAATPTAGYNIPYPEPF